MRVDHLFDQYILQDNKTHTMIVIIVYTYTFTTFFLEEGLFLKSSLEFSLSNIWMSKHDRTIKHNTKLYRRYMDVILRSTEKCTLGLKLI